MAKKDIQAELRKRRVELIKKIQKKRGSTVITYITSDRQNLSAMIEEDAINIISRHLIQNKIALDAKVDLFLYSRGGSSDVPWTLVSKFREYSPEGKFNVLVPYKCHSAGTVIILGADEIVMTKEAELTPIDATMNRANPQNPASITSISVEDVNGYFSLLKRLNNLKPTAQLKEQEVLSAFKDLSSKMDPLVLGHVNRIFEQTKLVAKRCINTRKTKVDEKEAESIVSKLSSEIFSHRHTIARSEAQNEIGIKNIKFAEDDGTDQLLWDLYREYEELLSLTTPFLPELFLIENNLSDHTWDKLPIAAIESVEDYHVKHRRVKSKRVYQTQPMANFNVAPLQLPNLVINADAGKALEIENIKKIFDAYINQTAPAIVKKAIEEVKNQYLSTLPEPGFQRTDINLPWVKLI